MKNSIIKSMTVVSLTMANFITPQVFATPADPSTDPLPAVVLNALADHDAAQGYLLLRDNTANIVYISPRYGVVGNDNGVPLLSLADVTQNGITFGVLNAAFDFAVDRDDFVSIRDAVESVGWALAPLPFESTTGSLSINSLNDSEDNGICGEVIDIITGELIPTCANFVVRSVVAVNGPTLGELYNAQLVLSDAGTQLYGKLLKGGNGISFNMEANYMAAFPAYTAKIDVSYKKLSDSYDSFSALHFSNCLDVQVRNFFKRESICRENSNGEVVSLNGGECSINVTYTNQRDEEVNNLFELPDNYTDEDLQNFAEDYNEQITTIHNAIEGLRIKFENEMLEKYPTASVDKTVNYNFIRRSDRLHFEDEANFSLERKSVGGTVLKRTTIPGLAICINTNPSTGDVIRYSGNSDCHGYWLGEAQPLDMLDDTNETDETDDGWF